MSPDLTTQAVSAALNNHWPEAIKLNLTLLKENPENVEALNRLARAYKENGEIKLSQKTYRKVLTLDHFNPIAQKNLKLLESSPRLFRWRNPEKPRSLVSSTWRPAQFFYPCAAAMKPA